MSDDVTQPPVRPRASMQASKRGSFASTLTPSMARIAERDLVVEVRGLVRPMAFEVGGKHGNIVTNSRTASVHKGWRVVAVDGKTLQPAVVSAALDIANRGSKFSVTFRIGDVAAYEGEEEQASKEGQADISSQVGVDEAIEITTNVAEDNNSDRKKVGFQNTPYVSEASAENNIANCAVEENTPSDPDRAVEENTRADPDNFKGAQMDIDEVIPDRLEIEESTCQERLEADKKHAEERLEASAGLPPRCKVDEPQQFLLQAISKGTVANEPPKKKGGPCDKCDGPHHGDECPYFKGKKRDQHKDAWDAYQMTAPKDEKTEEQFILHGGRIVRQPGDGSCLFHALAYGLGDCVQATSLRARVADFMSEHPDEVIAGNPLKDWVLWDSGLDTVTYAKSMRTGSRWGGAVEIAVCVQMHQIPVHVYEPISKGLLRISTFKPTVTKPGPVVNLCYGGRMHYDGISTSEPDKKGATSAKNHIAMTNAHTL